MSNIKFNEANKLAGTHAIEALVNLIKSNGGGIPIYDYRDYKGKPYVENLYYQVSDYGAVLDPSTKTGQLAIARWWNRDTTYSNISELNDLNEGSVSESQIYGVSHLDIKWDRFFEYDNGSNIKNGTYTILRGRNNISDLGHDGNPIGDISDKEVTVTIDDNNITFNFWTQEYEMVEVENPYYNANQPAEWIIEGTENTSCWDELENIFPNYYDLPYFPYDSEWIDVDTENEREVVKISNTPTITKEGNLIWSPRSISYSRDIANYPIEEIGEEDEEGYTTRGETLVYLYDYYRNAEDYNWSRTHWQLVPMGEAFWNFAGGHNEEVVVDDSPTTEYSYSAWLVIRCEHYTDIPEDTLYYAEMFDKPGYLDVADVVYYGNWVPFPYIRRSEYESLRDQYEHLEKEIENLKDKINRLHKLGEYADGGE